MDKELAQLQKEVIKRLIAYEDQLQAIGDTNQLKKTKRVSSSVAMNIAAFPNLIQELLDSGVSTEKVVRKLRNFQEGLLRDTVYLKGTETAHHKAMLRTGGSFYRGDPKIWQGITAQLSDFFETEFGDVPENISSYLNWAHKSDTNTKGLELSAIGKTANPDKTLTAHPWGTVASWITRDLTPQQLEDPTALFDEMARRIDAQVEAGKTADLTSKPFRDVIRGIDPRAYDPKNPVQTIQEVQKNILQPHNLLAIEQGIRDTVNQSGGSVTYNASMGLPPDIIERGVDLLKKPGLRRFGAAVPIAGTVLGATNVETSAAERDEEIAANPNDPTLKVNKVLDQISGWGDRTALAGYGAVGTGVGAPAGAPMIAVGEGASFLAGTTSLVIDGGRAITKWAVDPNSQFKDEEERSNLSFSSGAFK